MSSIPFQRVDEEHETFSSSPRVTDSREIRFRGAVQANVGQRQRRRSVEEDLTHRVSSGGRFARSQGAGSGYETLTDLEKDCQGYYKIISAIWNRHWHISRAEMLEHVSKRLEWHVQQMQSRALGGTTGENVSGVWVVPAVLNQMHHEFKDSDPFVRNIADLIDRCVQDVLQDNIHDSGGVFHAPWTEQGAFIMENYIEYLAELGDDSQEPSVYRSLQKIRREGEEGPEAGESHMRFVKDKLFPPGGPRLKPEWGGFFTRPFQIGVAALFKSGDYKTLVQILRGAKFYHDHIRQKNVRNVLGYEEMHSECHAFEWTEDVISLGGLHLSKFHGDSDTHFILTRRLNKIMDHTLPMIAQFLSCCSGNLRYTCTAAMEFQLVLLAACFAALNAVLSGVAGSEVVDTLISQWANAHFGNYSSNPS